jgi:hypothetical protein
MNNHNNPKLFRLNFLSQDEASVFSNWMNRALDYVCGRIQWPAPQEYGSVGTRYDTGSDGSGQNHQYAAEVRTVPKPPTIPMIYKDTNQNRVQNRTQNSQPENIQTYSVTQQPTYKEVKQISQKDEYVQKQVYQKEEYMQKPVYQAQPVYQTSHQNNLLAEIRNGPNLRPIVPAQSAKPAENNSFLSEVRSGTYLKSVEKPVIPGVPVIRPQLPVQNFNDQLKRKLAERLSQPETEPHKSNHGPTTSAPNSSDYSSETSPVGSGSNREIPEQRSNGDKTAEHVRQVIREELRTFRDELLNNFRDMVRNEIQHLQYDSNH